MASGQSIFSLEPEAGIGPQTDDAKLFFYNEGSTPGLILPSVSFPSASDTYFDWVERVPAAYGGGGFTFAIEAGVDGSETGDVGIDVKVLPIPDNADVKSDLGIDGQTALQLTHTPVTDPADKMSQWASGNLSHANAGSPIAGRLVVVRLMRRNAAGANTDNLRMIGCHVTET